MNHKKRVLIISLVVCILIAAVCLLIFIPKNPPVEEQLSFNERILQENFTGMTLTIYYADPQVYTRAPLTIQELIERVLDNNSVEFGNVITIDSKELQENKDLFKKMIHTELTPMKDNPTLNARIYLRFDSEKYGKLYDIAMWGLGDNGSNSIFVCDQPVQEEDIFYELIVKFAPEVVGYDKVQNYVEK